MGSHIQGHPQLKSCPVSELEKSCRFGHTRMGASRRNRTVPRGSARRGSWGAHHGLSTSTSCRRRVPIPSWGVPKAVCAQLCCVLSTALEGSHRSSCSYLVSPQTNRAQSPLSPHGAGEGSSQHLPAAPRLSSKLRDFFPFFPAFESCRRGCEAYTYPGPPPGTFQLERGEQCQHSPLGSHIIPSARSRSLPSGGETPWPGSPASPPACSAGG